MHIKDDIVYIGVNDHTSDLFEGQYAIPNGISYNSYVILDEKIAVLDTVDAGFTHPWLDNLKRALGGRQPDYLVVQHMEPDHAANIDEFKAAYPQATVVASARAFDMMQSYFGTDYAQNRLVVGEGDTLSLGRHHLTFITAPMVHWPEVIVTYDSTDKILFSADGFGKFGALDVEEDWLDEARRYYIGIVGKYGAPVQTLLKKASALDIAMICPLHGPVLKENLAYYLEKYRIWSGYESEEEGVVIAYTSIYGNTARAVDYLAGKLKRAVVYDLARCDMAQAVSDAFRFSKVVLATTTYNGDIFPYMHTFLHHLTQRNFQNKTVALMENGSWAPVAAKVMGKMLENSKQLTIAQPVVTIRGAGDEAAYGQLDALAKALNA